MVELDNEALTLQILTTGFLDVVVEVSRFMKDEDREEFRDKKLHFVFVLANVCAGPVEVKEMVLKNDVIKEFLYD